MAFDAQAAKQAGYSDEEIQQYLSNQGGDGAEQSQYSGSLLDSILSGKPTQGQAANKQMEDQVAQAILSHQSLSPEQSSWLGNQATGVVTGFGAGGPITETKNAVGGLLGFLTKGGVGKKIAQAAESATQSGKSVPQSGINDLIRNNVISKYGDTASVRQAVEKFLAGEMKSGLGEIAPNTPGIPNEVNQINPNIPSQNNNLLSSNPTQPETSYQGPLRSPTPYSGGAPMDISSANLSPNDLLAMRRTASTKIAPNYFSNILSLLTGQAKGDSQLDQSIANTARQVYSGQLKTLAPDIKIPDKAYSFYSKYGDPAGWIKGYLAAETLKHTPLGNIPVVGDILRSTPGP